jgi:hypothetical protein
MSKKKEAMTFWSTGNSTDIGVDLMEAVYTKKEVNEDLFTL